VRVPSSSSSSSSSTPVTITTTTAGHVRPLAAVPPHVAREPRLVARRRRLVRPARLGAGRTPGVGRPLRRLAKGDASLEIPTEVLWYLFLLLCGGGAVVAREVLFFLFLAGAYV
jgi:hypothetical protein